MMHDKKHRDSLQWCENKFWEEAYWGLPSDSPVLGLEIKCTAEIQETKQARNKAVTKRRFGFNRMNNHQVGVT
jgi:hypothetical protein